jgi:hypothetical protein
MPRLKALIRKICKKKRDDGEREEKVILDENIYNSTILLITGDARAFQGPAGGQSDGRLQEAILPLC